MLPDDFEARFGGIGRVYGIKGLEKIKKAKILIIGIGGVGSWVAESLARSGVGHQTLVDLDDVCVTNINRQIHALNGTVGKFKVDVMKERILQINPYSEIDTKQYYFNPKNLDVIFDKSYDFVVDACDDFTNKCYLIDHCRKNNLPLVVMGGAGGKKDPSQINITDQMIAFWQGLEKNSAKISHFPERMRVILESGPFGQESVRFIQPVMVV